MSAALSARTSEYVPRGIRAMTISDVACAIIGGRDAVDAFDAMRDHPSQQRVDEFTKKMNALRALVGLGSDPIGRDA